jgi:hypothetical protein
MQLTKQNPAVHGGSIKFKGNFNSIYAHGFV